MVKQPTKPPGKKQKRWQIYIGKELFEDMREAAFRTRLTYHDIVTAALREWFKAHAKRGKKAA